MDKKSVEKIASQITSSKRGLISDIWDGEGADAVLRKDISGRLKKIALDVWEGLEHGSAELLDIIFTGSCAGLNWTPSSDIDLHLVVQMSDMGDDEELIDSYCRARTKLWNREHDVDVHGHPVEVYIQDADEEHHSSNVYSVMNDRWIKGPVDVMDDPPESGDIAKKALMIAKDIERLISRLHSDPSQTAIDAADRLRERVRKMRGEGLRRDGEDSLENLVFKVLRRVGVIDELAEAQRTAYDSIVSIDG